MRHKNRAELIDRLQQRVKVRVAWRYIQVRASKNEINNNIVEIIH